ncbi:GDP-L-fucose synthase [Luteibacter sp.]|uniref:GDP-L-fucose synthase family protein n=1 Tax=Luteibacter sp. TaxID=1886636 RepID=UPI0028077C09|nr:GDP-L-fucose synthase [Luteibacter sp.]MDQ7956692.1 GDP-L-fucose synthase [Pseudomonadota bacterium]MDQ7998632.1 GDP-L-fucose synthase [Pseudomonadota bacterium]MDQ8015759.1 GDP-L-fucose synthase [Pseudomonadota bacterium]MDQ8050675.1 GDP-L-fucose synthase [Luteibacter sp.]
MSKVFVAGHRGLVGSATLKALGSQADVVPIVRTHSELDLADRQATLAFFEQERPDQVVMCAAKVGGILANASLPVDFLHDNLAIQLSVFEAAHAVGVKRMIFLGSSCIYPRDCPQPIKEDYLLTGPLEATNRPYALAKIAGVEACWSYNRQFGTQYLALMPTNMYGPGDNYHPEHSHVMPALLRRFHEAKARGDESVVVWGSGRPRREFMYSSDLGEAIAFLLALPDDRFAQLIRPEMAPLINVGVGEDITIGELAELVKKTVGYGGRLEFDASKPDGTPRKLMDVSRLHALGWRARTQLEEGLRSAYEDFLRHSASSSAA